jgi:hypothetical protein
VQLSQQRANLVLDRATIVGVRLAAVLVVLACCRGGVPAPAPGSADALAAYLAPLAGADEATRRHEVASWILDEATWRATVVPAYAPLYGDYARGHDAASAPLVARLAARGLVTARRHYAGDLRLTPSEGRVRWALPVQYPSMVAELGGAPIDAVFVWDGAHWRVLVGVDELVIARVRARDSACADRVARAGPANECTAVSWAIADSALRDDDAGFAHGCDLAVTLCANRSP